MDIYKTVLYFINESNNTTITKDKLYSNIFLFCRKSNNENDVFNFKEVNPQFNTRTYKYCSSQIEKALGLLIGGNFVKVLHSHNRSTQIYFPEFQYYLTGEGIQLIEELGDTDLSKEIHQFVLDMKFS
jgi:hypothetical protein